MASSDFARRRFLGAATLGGIGMAIADLPALQAQAGGSDKKAEPEVSPTEDLMREHGLLGRILLIYDDAGRRLGEAGGVDPRPLAQAASIVRRFIEQYHEKLEEEFLFPRFEKAGRLTDLVKTLRTQHAAGRPITDRIEKLSTAAAIKDAEQRKALQAALASFIHMYRPHKAREDTVLFPAVHQIVTAKEFDSLGDQFEDRETKLFGEGGFEKMVEEVAGLEKTLGLYELAQYTPR